MICDNPFAPWNVEKGSNNKNNKQINMKRVKGSDLREGDVIYPINLTLCEEQYSCMVTHKIKGYKVIKPHECEEQVIILANAYLQNDGSVYHIYKNMLLDPNEYYFLIYRKELIEVN